MILGEVEWCGLWSDLKGDIGSSSSPDYLVPSDVASVYWLVLCLEYTAYFNPYIVVFAIIL